MIAATRAEVLRLLAELSETLPEMRFGQLVANLALSAGRDGAMWDVEDDQLLDAARRLIARNRTREVALASFNGVHPCPVA